MTNGKGIPVSTSKRMAEQIKKRASPETLHLLVLVAKLIILSPLLCFESAYHFVLPEAW